MDHAALMRVLHGLADTHEDRQPLRHAESIRARVFCQRQASDQLHREEWPTAHQRASAGEVGDPGLIDLRDARMLESPQHLALKLEAPQQPRRGKARPDHLQRHRPARAFLLCEIDHAHAALAKDLHQPVRTDALITPRCRFAREPWSRGGRLRDALGKIAAREVGHRSLVASLTDGRRSVPHQQRSCEGQRLRILADAKTQECVTFALGEDERLGKQPADLLASRVAHACFRCAVPWSFEGYRTGGGVVSALSRERCLHRTCSYVIGAAVFLAARPPAPVSTYTPRRSAPPLTGDDPSGVAGSLHRSSCVLAGSWTHRRSLRHPEHDLNDRRGVDARDHVIDQDPQSRRKPLELARRPGLHDVQNPE